jgi:hypothetical protein
MSKRPSVIGNLALPPDPPASAPAGEGPAEKAKRRARPEIVHTSVYIPRPVYQKLRQIAFETDCKIHDVIMEGIDAALRKAGHPSIAELKQQGAKA